MSTIEEIKTALKDVEHEGEAITGVFVLLSNEKDPRVDEPTVIINVGQTEEDGWYVDADDACRYFLKDGWRFNLACEACTFDEPCYEHNESYRLYCDEQTAIHEGLAMELVHCYLCFLEQTGKADMSPKHDQGPLRGVERHSTRRTHRTHPEADVYDVMHLVPCGHALI